MAFISASIVLYKNEVNIVKNAILSFLNTQYHVILYLIDNSPTDELKNIIQDDRVFYFHNPTNSGFGAGHNIAIKKALEIESDYHIVLNPDIYFEKNTLENIVKFMEIEKVVGHVMPKILFPDQSFQYLCKMNPTFFDLFARGFLPSFIKKILKKRLNKYEYRESNFDNIIYDIPYLSGCFMFFRTSTLKKVGFFDERIFMYLEDADITRRFLQFSRTAYFPGAFVYHHYAGLAHKQFKFKLITIKSAITYFNKWGWIKNLY